MVEKGKSAKLYTNQSNVGLSTNGTLPYKAVKY